MKKLSSLVCLLAILLVVLPGPLYKWQFLDLGTAFTSIRYGVFAAIAGLVLLLVQAGFYRKTIHWPLFAISGVFAVVAIVMPLSIMSKAKSVPPIHDISTDVVTPPEFVAIAKLRADAPNPAKYAGAETAAQQLKAYPSLTTLTFKENTKHVIRVSIDSVKSLGWELVSADVEGGIIEATDTTLWFGFKDDVVIRVTAKGDGSELDIRSKSRVGKSDLGKNAERISQFITLLNTQLSQL
ncbi:DUF1499 domain-containing protein [Pseudoalteromonas shioyasakiensis]|uniref:DUF1499 domain-containing protein n=1 Tax=Pseudoalteromonas shioyasakiensis TaxID=1190813 RepID=UPI00211861A7|nr:DUF1499 domain-containing protein [Pseudoalteromonas shioyasakiensis]MCQ8877915.1 DUF1499 domain-containing protein [Pseudoalteromonas shioyasakiensis]